MLRLSADSDTRHFPASEHSSLVVSDNSIKRKSLRNMEKKKSLLLNFVQCDNLVNF